MACIAPWDSPEGVEVGDLPRGVSLSQLRWTGSALVDLAALDALYVGPAGTLHAHEVPGSQPVVMTWADRSRLVRNGDGWRVRSVEEEQAQHLEQARRLKLREILAGADAMLAQAAARFSEFEQKSWPRQEAEARALVEDESAPAPLLREIAVARGMDVLALRDRVLANVAAWEVISGSIMGQQQACEDRLKAAQTLEEIAAIVPEYSLPVG